MRVQESPVTTIPRDAEGRRRRWLSIWVVTLLAAAGLVVIPAPAQAAVQMEFFLAPDGSDSNSGTDAEHPLATLAEARDKVRALADDMTGDIVVNVAAGEYFVTDTVTFDERDSGTNGFSVIYRQSDGDGSAKFIGGSEVTSTWSLVSGSATGIDEDLPDGAVGGVYKTDIGEGLDLNTLYVDDVRATKARTPNRVVNPRFPMAQTNYLTSSNGGVRQLNYAASTIDSTSLTGLVNAQARGDLNAQVYAWDGSGWNWMTSTIPLGSIDTSARALHFLQVPDHPELNMPHYSYGNSRFFVQGNLGFLDQPGEFYYNKVTGYLYYYPLAGSGPIADQSIVVPAVEKVVEVKGASPTSLVSNIVFDGLEFKDTNFPDYYTYGWNSRNVYGGLNFYPPEATRPGSVLPSRAENSERPQFQVGVITLVNTSHITITNSRIKNAGMFGVALYKANQYATIENSMIEYTGHGGVNIDGGYSGVDGTGNVSFTNNNTVANTIIHDIGQLVGQTAGVTINNATSNTVTDSEIYNSPRRAIFLTGGGYQRPEHMVPSPNGDADFDHYRDLYAHHNVISRTYVHDLQQDGGDDGGIFTFELYLRGEQHRPNTIDQVIIDKVGSNPSQRDYAPNGMNLDVGAAGVAVSNFQSLNPQNYNTIVNYGPETTFTNTNVNYGAFVNQLDSFDPSLMDYANIGVDFSNPYKTAPPTVTPPTNVYFEDAFEGEHVDGTKWRWRGYEPAITHEFTSEGVRNLATGGVVTGRGAVIMRADKTPSGSKPVLYRDFGSPLSKVVTVKMFDRQSGKLAAYDTGAPNPINMNTLARADNGGAGVLGLGVDTSMSTAAYVMQIGATKTVTNVPRGYGWHELEWDYTSGTDVKLSIDGVQVATAPATTFDRIELGTDDAIGNGTFDQVSVHGGTGTGTAPALDPPLSVADVIQAESRASASGTSNASGGSGTVVTDLNGGDWLKYEDVNFGNSTMTAIQLRVAVDAASAGKKIDLRLDGESGPVIGTATIESTGGWTTYKTQQTPILPTTGLHDLYLVPQGAGSDFANIDWFTFNKPASLTIEAESWVAKAGTTNVAGGTGTIVGNINGGTWLKYGGLDFGTSGLTQFQISLSSPSSGRKLEVRLDTVSGPVIGTLTIASTGSYTTYTTQSTPIVSTTGVHDVFIRPVGSGDGFAGIDWFTFNTPTPVPPTPATSKIEAESRTAASGTQNVTGGTGTIVGHINTGTWLKYANVDFGAAGLKDLRISLSSPISGRQLEVRVDDVSGPVIATVTIASTGSYTTYATQTVPIVATTGVHDVFIRPVGSGDGFAGIDWFTFSTDATSTIEAESRAAAHLTQNVSGGTGTVVGHIDGGTWLKYRGIDFGATGLTEFQISLSSPSSGKQLEVRLDTVGGPIIGTLTITSTGSYTTYATQTAAITPTTGVHDVFIRPVGNGSGFAGIDWFTFQ